MNGPKEAGPYLSVEDLYEAINSLRIPDTLRDKIASMIGEIPLDDVYENLSDKKKEELEQKVADGLRDSLREELEKEYAEEYGEGADQYVRLVVRSLFDISLSDLKPLELREIEDIRKQLEIPGSFNPDA